MEGAEHRQWVEIALTAPSKDSNISIAPILFTKQTSLFYFFAFKWLVCVVSCLYQRDKTVSIPQGAVVILTVNYNNMSNWATQFSAILLPNQSGTAQLNCERRPVSGCVVGGCSWLAGCETKNPGCAGMLRGEVCRPVVLQVIADISSFVHLIADLHCL